MYIIYYNIIYNSLYHINTVHTNTVLYTTSIHPSLSPSLPLPLLFTTGTVLLGVDKHSEYFSFLEEPFTRIKITTEVGEQFKLKDIPKLSNYMTNKLREQIRKKLVCSNILQLYLIFMYICVLYATYLYMI